MRIRRFTGPMSPDRIGASVLFQCRQLVHVLRCDSGRASSAMSRFGHRLVMRTATSTSETPSATASVTSTENGGFQSAGYSFPPTVTVAKLQTSPRSSTSRVPGACSGTGSFRRYVAVPENPRRRGSGDCDQSISSVQFTALGSLPAGEAKLTSHAPSTGTDETSTCSGSSGAAAPPSGRNTTNADPLGGKLNVT